MRAYCTTPKGLLNMTLPLINIRNGWILAKRKICLKAQPFKPKRKIWSLHLGEIFTSRIHHATRARNETESLQISSGEEIMTARVSVHFQPVDICGILCGRVIGLWPQQMPDFKSYWMYIWYISVVSIFHRLNISSVLIYAFDIVLLNLWYCYLCK